MALKLQWEWQRPENFRAPVWQARNGVRVHRLGLVREASGHIHDIDRRLFAPIFRQTGGNYRRALMAYAERYCPTSDTKHPDTGVNASKEQ